MRRDNEYTHSRLTVTCKIRAYGDFLSGKRVQSQYQYVFLNIRLLRIFRYHPFLFLS